MLRLVYASIGFSLFSVSMMSAQAPIPEATYSSDFYIPGLDTPLDGRCLSSPWASADNFEAVAAALGIDEEMDFAKNPGKYAAQLFANPQQVFPSWCEHHDGGFGCDTGVSIIHNLQFCGLKAEQIGLFDSSQFRVWYVDDGELCAQSLSDDGSYCLTSFWVEISEHYPGGHPEWKSLYGLYGILDHPVLDQIIVPLQFVFFREEMIEILSDLK